MSDNKSCKMLQHGKVSAIQQLDYNGPNCLPQSNFIWPSFNIPRPRSNSMSLLEVDFKVFFTSADETTQNTLAMTRVRLAHSKENKLTYDIYS